MKNHASDAEVERLRKALLDFMKSRHLVLTTWAKASGVSETSLRWFLILKRTRSLNDLTYRKLAANQNVPVAVLRGEQAGERDIPIRSYVGAGAEIVPFEGDEPVDYVTVPAGLEPLVGGGYRVKGTSMEPMFHDGDVIFPEPHPVPPDKRIGSIVIADLKDGRRLVKKLIRGSKRGRFTLLSVNPAEPPFEDQLVLNVAALPWVNRKI